MELFAFFLMTTAVVTIATIANRPFQQTVRIDPRLEVPPRPDETSAYLMQRTGMPYDIWEQYKAEGYIPVDQYKR
jgi:hypothetical protein